MVIKQILRPAAVAALATGLVLSSCSSGDPDVAPTAAADEIVQDDNRSTVADGQPDDLALVDDAEPGRPEFTGKGSGPWCAAIEDVVIDQGFNPLAMDVFGLTAAEMEERYSTNHEVFTRMMAVATDEIEEPVGSVATVFETFLSKGAAAGWDLDAMLADPEFLAAFDVVALQTSIGDIERYTLEVCGIDLS